MSSDQSNTPPNIPETVIEPPAIPATNLVKIGRPVRGGLSENEIKEILEKYYSSQEIAAMQAAGVDKRMVFGINPYYHALIKGEEFKDAQGRALLPKMPPSKALQALVIPVLAEVNDLNGQPDPSGQMEYSPDSLKGKILHKYDEIVLGYAALACSAHCRYCYRLDLFKGDTGKGLVKPEELRDYIRDYNQRYEDGGGIDSATGERRYPIREVLLSGGDPMVMNNKQLYGYLAAAAEAGVNMVRIGTKELAFRPQRFDENFIQTLRIFHQHYPGVHLNFVTHFTHPDEMLERNRDGEYIREANGYRWLTPVKDAVEALSALDFVSLDNQTPIIRRVNDDVAALHLLHEELRRKNVKPKYLFQCRQIEGHKAFALPVEDAWRIHRDSQRGVSDAARSRFAMSTEAGKLEVVSVLDAPSSEELEKLPQVERDLLGSGLVIFKVHRSPFSAETQGDLVIAKGNPNALWISDYKDRILYDGRKQNDKFTGLTEVLAATTQSEAVANSLANAALAGKGKQELLELAPEQFLTAQGVAQQLFKPDSENNKVFAEKIAEGKKPTRDNPSPVRKIYSLMFEREKYQKAHPDEAPVVFRLPALPGLDRGPLVTHRSDIGIIESQLATPAQERTPG